MLRTYRYEEIAGDLRRRIASGEWRGTRLPSERDLMERYGVQRNTLRKALELLATEGWIVTEAKRGSFIAPDAPSEKRLGLTAFKAMPQGAVLLVTARNDFSTARESILSGVSEALESAGLPLQYFNSRPGVGREMHEIPTPEYLAANGVSGVILWPQTPADVEALRRLRGLVPLILVDRRVLGFEADYVGFDDTAGARMVTEHLLSLGHRHIGFLGDEVFAESVQQRWRGYTLALESAGVAVDRTCTALFNCMPDATLAAHLRLFLEGGGDPLTAVVCSNDSTALRLLRFLRAEGRRVPEDVAVTGYGDLLPNYLDALGMTTVSQPFVELGRRAGAMLLDRLAQCDGRSEFRQVELPGRLIVRESSGAGRLAA